MSEYEKIGAKLSLLEKHNLSNASGYLPDPAIAPSYYRYIFCDPLNDKQIIEFYETCNFHITDYLKEFYQFWNGLRLNQSISIYGSLANRGRQPISLDYGNYFERPENLPKNSTVIGSKHLSYTEVGYLISNGDGSVTCTSSLLLCDEVERWSSISALIETELE